MDHNGGFAAQDSIDTAQRRKQDSKKQGEDTMLIAEGGVDNHSTREVEETPLLRAPGDEDDSEDAEFSRKPSYYDWDHLPWWKRPSPYWLLGPFVLSALAFGGIMVPKINLIMSLICREYYADKSLHDPGLIFAPIDLGKLNPMCRTPEVQKRVAEFTMQGGLISGILAAIIAPKLGALSDRYGRKPIMCITNFGMFTGEIITIIAATYPETFHVNWMLLGYFFDGLCGSFIASMAMSHSYATDSSPPDRRNVVFGYFHGALFTGIAIGPALAGYIIQATGSVITMFYIALACHIFFILFLVLVIPESLSKSRQHLAREKYAVMIEARGPTSDWIQQIWAFNLFEPLKILFPTGVNSSPAIRRNLMLLASVDMIIFGVAMGAMTVVIIYSNFVFAWSTFEQSIFMSVINSCRVLCLLIILPGVTRLYRGKGGNRRAQPQTGTDTFELTIIRIGIMFDMLGFLGYTLSRQSGWFMASGAIASIGGMASPTLQAALTKHVPPSQVGQLLGAMGLLHAFARIIAPTVFNAIYIATVGSFPQTCFVILTVMFGLAWTVSWFVKPGVTLGDETTPREARNTYRDDPDAVEEQLGI
ncbi:MFS general substrate transporter [Tothia fuscella]|uniref:MFS general substrate transporter n=1 Tax=Tothia fuscella TaxID=1048955 RepID=A0A9P4NZI8_9PEZI|nr:MFS general substrate transporter [Tothia fuscella]